MAIELSLEGGNLNFNSSLVTQTSLSLGSDVKLVHSLLYICMYMLKLIQS